VPTPAAVNAHIPAQAQSTEPEADTPAFAPAYAMASAPVSTAHATAFAPGAAPASQPRPETVPAASPEAAPALPASGKLSLYQRLSNSPEAEAGRAKAPARKADSVASYVQDIPSADDETIEESGVFGRAAVERILGGKLIEERSLDGSPLVPRY
jgi:DNA polymerase-3 subunit gamma/tau